MKLFVGIVMIVIHVNFNSFVSHLNKPVITEILK